MPTVKKKKTTVRSVWAGPESNSANGGITQSKIGRFLVCRRRFGVMVVEGLQPAPRFNHRMEYGNMGHTCEEAYGKDPTSDKWQLALRDYCRKLCDTYRNDQEEISRYYNICKVQFQAYIDYWKKHSDVKNRTPLMHEEVFNVPYTLPSGRTVRLRGKFDGVDIIGKGKGAGIYLQENKYKGDFNGQSLKRQLMFDLQTMMYLIALKEKLRGQNLPRVAGVRYNVVRRPLAGGKYSIRKHKATSTKPEETEEEFYTRLAGLIHDDCREALKEKTDSWFFMRWKSEVSDYDIEEFKRTFFNPILEQICCWYDNQVGKECSLPGWAMDYRLPYGIYNPVMDGVITDVDNYLDLGTKTGLAEVTNLFPELT